MASAGELLGQAGIAPFEARLLLSVASGIGSAILLAFPEREIPDPAAALFLQYARRRRAGEPVAYILGKREFYGREFAVTPDVLIPRPETELLVELALARLQGAAPATQVLDLGTGSGIVAVTLACEATQLAVTALDRSAAALALARANAARLCPQRRVEFAESDWFEALGNAHYAMIVGNPPYVADGDAHLSTGDLRHEPRTALAAGPQGMDAIARIVAGAPRHLEPGGWLLLEHGYDQGGACRSLLNDAGYRDVTTWRDLAGLERVSGGVLALAGDPPPATAIPG